MDEKKYRDKNPIVDETEGQEKVREYEKKQERDKLFYRDISLGWWPY